MDINSGNLVLGLPNFCRSRRASNIKHGVVLNVFLIGSRKGSISVPLAEDITGKDVPGPSKVLGFKVFRVAFLQNPYPVGIERLVGRF